MDERKPVPRRVRFEVLRRDGYICRYCGAQAPDVKLTVDHVIPTVLGGSDDPSNLVTACQPCNAGKASTSPDEHIVADVDAATFLFAKAMERAATIRRNELGGVDAAIDQFARQWTEWSYGEQKTPLPLPHGWRSSVGRFIELGLTHDDLRYFTRVAMEGPSTTDETFRYFCGCCWREITTRQELARQLIEDGET